MAFNNSVYNVQQWFSTTSYTTDDIVARIEYIGSGTNRVPRGIKYYYATQASTGGDPQDPEISPGKPNYSSEYWKGYVQVNGQAIPSFSWTPSYNVSTKHNPRVNVVRFGNGYEQRNADGLFSNLIDMDITFEKRPEREAKNIIHFLKARKGVESFVFENLPNLYADNTAGGYRKRFVSATFNSTFVFFNNYTVTASFSQENN